MDTDDTEPRLDYFSATAGELTFDQLASRLAELEEWGWVGSDPEADPHTRQEVFDRVFPHGQSDIPWNDYHWVRSMHDSLAAEHFDLGQ